jgi:succinoglycan biosynthesis transport protein ExoP
VATEETHQRLENLKPEILSRTRLQKVLDATNPYPEIHSATAAIDTIRDATSINQSGTDGFTIEYVHRDAHKAQEVTDRLATLFIEETVRSHGQQVEEAVDFLVAQVTESRKALETKEEAVRRFKEQRMGRLPQQLDANLATLNMLQRELQTIEESLLFARERQQSMARGASRPPATTASRSNEASGAENDLGEMRRQLAALKGRYTDEHPDVQSLRTRIARLEARLAAASGGNAGTADVDPSVTVARDQLSQASAEIKKLEGRQAEIERRVTELRARVEETPRTEQELSTLMRDYDKIKENYTALLSKQMEAQMAGRLEQRWKGDRFRVLDPAHLPEKPYSPKRLVVLGGGLIAGLFAGLVLCLGIELMDPTVKGADELASLASFPVLARIPHLDDLPGTR